MPSASEAQLPLSPSASASSRTSAPACSEAGARRTPRTTWESDDGEGDGEAGWALGLPSRNPSMPGCLGMGSVCGPSADSSPHHSASPTPSGPSVSVSAGGAAALGQAPTSHHHIHLHHRAWHRHRVQRAAAAPGAAAPPAQQQQHQQQQLQHRGHSESAGGERVSPRSAAGVMATDVVGTAAAAARSGSGSGTPPLSQRLRRTISRVHPASPASTSSSISYGGAASPPISAAALAAVSAAAPVAPVGPVVTVPMAAAEAVLPSAPSLLYPSHMAARSSSPGSYPAGAHAAAVFAPPSPPPSSLHHHHHHSISVGGAALRGSAEALSGGAAAALPPPPTRLPPLLVTPAAAALPGPSTSSRVSRVTSDDVEVATQDQAASGGSAAAAAGAGAGAATQGPGAGDAGGSTSGGAGDASAKQRRLQARVVSTEGGAAAAAGPAAPTVAAPPAGPDASAATATAPAPSGGSRVQLSVSVIGAPPSAATTANVGAAGGAAAAPPQGEVPAAVGVPVLLLPPMVTPEGRLSNVTVIGRPAEPPVGGGAAAGGAARIPEPGVDGVDAVANITAVGTAAAGGTARRRQRNSSGVSSGGGAGGDGEESGVDEDAGGPCALPAELRRRLRVALGRQRMKGIRTWKDLSYSMASPRPGYWLIGTMLLCGTLLGAFLFMAGQYEFLRGSALLLARDGEGDGAALLARPPPPHPPSAASPCWGPHCLGGWLAFWRSPPSRSFSFDYLRAWGGRYGPDLASGQWWRWCSSLLLHASPMHLASNLALMLVLSSYLESLYGCWRVMPVWLLAGVAGNMASAFFESPCTLVVGSSGAVLGLLGAYGADAAVNWESLPLLWLRLAGMAGLGALMLTLQLTNHGGSSGSVSNASHAAGFLVGLLAAAVVTPDFKARRCEKVKRLLSGLGLGSHLPPPASPGGRQLFSFWQRHRYVLYGLYGTAVVVLLLALVGVPLHVYLRTLRDLTCS